MKASPWLIGPFVLLLTANQLAGCNAFQNQSPTIAWNLAPTSIAGGRIVTTLYQSSSDNTNDKAAKVRFSGTTTTSNNAWDSVISVISSDVASIGLGLLGLCLLLIERLTIPDAATLGENPSQYAVKLGEETRSNLIAVIACGSVLLNGLSKLDVTSALAETVTLDGMVLSEPIWLESSMGVSQDIYGWGMESFLRATPAKIAVILRAESKDPWKVVAMLGTVPAEAALSEQPIILPSTPILDRCKKADSDETYLPTLQALPGKVEFTYLPSNTQEVLILPVPTSSVESAATAIVLGSNCAKSFTPRDIAWCQTIAARIGSVAYSRMKA
jgi:Cofactor assembly of complex C subunit B, CCB2/CCB4